MLKGGGECLITVWAFEQESSSRRKFEEQDVFVPWVKRSDAGRGPEGDTIQRYCHVFREGELASLVQAVPGMRVIDSYYDRGNWAVRAKKEVEGSEEIVET